MTPSRPLPRFRFGFVLLLACVVSTAHAQDANEEDDEFRPGLVGRYEPDGAPAFSRTDRELGLDQSRWSLDERLEGRPFHVRWTGLLETDGAGKHYFAAYFAGTIRVEVDGQVVLEGKRVTPGWLVGPATQLPTDWLETDIAYRSPAQPQDARLRLYWKGPGYELEPIPERVWSHERLPVEPADEATGRLHWTAKHCGRCHTGPQLPEIPIPHLKHARQTLRPEWVVEHLMARKDDSNRYRNMPYYGLNRRQAEQITAFLWDQSVPTGKAKPNWSTQYVGAESKPAKKKKKSKPLTAEQRRARQHRDGKRLVFTLGCLACHAFEQEGHPSIFGGPDLARVASKRPTGFVLHWLGDPGSLQAEHAMPRFPLSKQEASAVASFLEAPPNGQPARRSAWNPSRDRADIDAGRKLFVSLECIACHDLSNDAIPEPSDRKPKAIRHVVDQGWHGKTKAPFSWDLDATVRRPLIQYMQQMPPDSDARRAAQVLIEQRNCLTCHRRGSREGLASIAARLAERSGVVAMDPARLVPPSLDSVGHKFPSETLVETIASGSAIRPFLSVRMPHFGKNMAGQTLAAFFETLDDVPSGSPIAEQLADVELDPITSRVVGSRLVTTDGFGCTSCHALGGVEPPPGPINARGPDLTQPGRRMRRVWFERWVHNPTRIVPRMEMPGVKIAVHGVLDNRLDRQLAVLWNVLNEPGFRPPQPNPIRTLRQLGTTEDATDVSRARFVTDVVHHGDAVYVKPLLIGLANRHSVLFDLETGRLVLWMTGDIARQRTQGKTWFWETAGTPLWESSDRTPELELVRGGKLVAPQRLGQFVTEFDVVRHESHRGAITVVHRLHVMIGSKRHTVRVTQGWSVPEGEDAVRGFDRTIAVDGLPDGWQVRFRPLPQSAKLENSETARVTLASGSATPDGAGWILTGSRPVRFAYRTSVRVDRFPELSQPSPEREPVDWHNMPGFRVTRLPLSNEIMPTGFGWLPDGPLAITSLKGRVWLARDRDGDGIEETAWPATDELAAPYGAHGRSGCLDVINKYALLRLFDDDGDGRFDRYVRLASGWGHTTDYHDWAVGLPIDRQGNYYVAFPCQQDDRSQVAARLRGTVIRLAPREPTRDDPSAFAVDRLTGGHRFPMGIARNRSGDLFVTDNQGNYNPFNELNHVQRGRRYGFYNKLEKQAGLKSPTTAPAIKIPHPWTRSVNGICFLNDPRKRGRFGPFEGHLVGCEMNGKKLVRMTLEVVDGTYQGAAYPFSYEPDEKHPTWLGPLACAVSPAGDLYVGSLIDSGWGGGNNVGEVIRCQPDLGRLPAGIRVVRIRHDGYRIEFTRPVDRELASDPSRYAISSYTRIPTPAYGGPDVKRRSEPIAHLEVSEDGRRVDLRLQHALRPGFVYEFHLKPLVRPPAEFFPSEAHYTASRIPIPPR